MSKRGPQCSICTHVKGKAIDADLAAGIGLAATSLKFGPATATLEKHRRLHLRPRLEAIAGGVKEKAPPPPMPDLPADISPKDRAKAHCDWLRLRIQWVEQNSASEKDLAHMAGQYTNATRLYSRLSGALDITESQIARSVPWQRLMVVVREALKPHPKALEDLMKAVEAYSEGETQ